MPMPLPTPIGNRPFNSAWLSSARARRWAVIVTACIVLTFVLSIVTVSGALPDHPGDAGAPSVDAAAADHDDDPPSAQALPAGASAKSSDTEGKTTPRSAISKLIPFPGVGTVLPLTKLVGDAASYLAGRKGV